ncbi:MAG: hypothetical protein KAU41_04325 [Deltaproteobacteria bacterium]|nr:hypothetical protein [Deltaproteobacteria bacterium]
MLNSLQFFLAILCHRDALFLQYQGVIVAMMAAMYGIETLIANRIDKAIYGRFRQRFGDTYAPSYRGNRCF